jgi:hypothetical protein
VPDKTSTPATETTPVGNPAGKFSGSEPQIATTMPRRITASPTVAITIEKTGSPSIGRMMSRSSTSPIAMEMGIVTTSSGKNDSPSALARLKET